MKIEVLFPSLSTIFIAFICGLVVALNQQTLIETGLMLFCAVVLPISSVYFSDTGQEECISLVKSSVAPLPFR